MHVVSGCNGNINIILLLLVLIVVELCSTIDH